MEREPGVAERHRDSVMAAIAQLTPYCAYRDQFPVVMAEKLVSIATIADREANASLVRLVGDLNNFALATESVHWLRRYQVRLSKLVRDGKIGIGDIFTLADLVTAAELQICSTRKMYFDIVVAGGNNGVAVFPQCRRTGDAQEKLVEPLVLVKLPFDGLHIIELSEIIRVACNLVNDMFGEDPEGQAVVDEEHYQSHAVELAKALGMKTRAFSIVDGGNAQN